MDLFDAFADEEWGLKQIDYMTRISENVGDALACQSALISNGRLAERLEIVLLNRKECSLEELIVELGKRNKIKFTLGDKDDDDDGKVVFGAQVVDSVGPFIGKEVDEDRLYFLVDFPDKAPPDQLESYIENGRGALAYLFRAIKEGLGHKVKIKGNVSDADDYTRRQVFHIEMHRVFDVDESIENGERNGQRAR